MFDTHAHLQAFDDAVEVMDRAREAGVEGVIVPGDALASSARALELASSIHDVYPAVGIHPHEAKDLDETSLKELKRLALSGGVVAIGEIGLDYHYNHSPRDVQRSAFAGQLELAKELDLPAIIHDREAHADTLDILRTSGHHSGVFHCFSGDIDFAREVLSLGFYVAIAGPVTFKNAETAREVAAFIPSDRLLVETDAPYLAPHPHRGRRNEPSLLPLIVERIAGLRSVPDDVLACVTRDNAANLFGV